ncbi:hypothetical protein K7G98_41055, partial [Saccharothrix sp. MB29]|nr:hypothetical protein [Saccharothrix sp. MB29]
GRRASTSSWVRSSNHRSTSARTLVLEGANAHLVLNFLVAKIRLFTRPGARPAGRAAAMRTALAVLEARKPGSRRSAVLAHLDDFPE